MNLTVQPAKTKERKIKNRRTNITHNFRMFHQDVWATLVIICDTLQPFHFRVSAKFQTDNILLYLSEKQYKK